MHLHFTCIALIATLILSSCSQGTVNSSSSDYTPKSTASTKPINIKGLSLDQSREQMKLTVETTVGCKFAGNERDPRDIRDCCKKPTIRDDGSSYCRGDPDVYIGGNSYILFKCEAYSGCQYSSSEVIQLLSKKYGLEFVSDEVHEFVRPCSVSNLGEKLCLAYDKRMKWNGGLGPKILLQRHKFGRDIDL